MFSINLVPEVQQKKRQVAKRNTYATIFAVSLLGACAAGLLIMGGIKVSKNSQLANAEEEIQRLETEAETYKELEEIVVSLEKGLAGVNSINDGGYDWTKLLPHMENATPSDVQFVGLSLSGNSISASLKGKDINSLARFVESFKKYQIVSITGSGTVGESVVVSVDNGAEYSMNVKSDGTWTHAASFDPTKDHIITVVQNGEEKKISYSGTTKKLNSQEASFSANVVSLFTDVNTAQYKKDGSQVTFSSDITFAGESIW